MKRLFSTQREVLLTNLMLLDFLFLVIYGLTGSSSEDLPQTEA